MKKAAVASLLAVSALMFPGTIARYNTAMAQAAAPAAPAGQVQMDPDEFKMYNDAATMTDPKAQAPALEAYLAKYPNSAVKKAVLVQIMGAYAGFDHAKAIDAADKVLQADPSNMQAYIVEVAYRSEAANALTDAAAKQSGLDSAADYAQRGLKLAQGPKPDGVSDADWAKLKGAGISLFYRNIGADLLMKKDSAGSIAAYKGDLATLDPNSLDALQDTFYVGQAYYIATPPDYLNCAFYTTRTAALAPDQYKSMFQPTATYCYKKYHGGSDGYDVLVALAKANPNPPADLGDKVKPAPTDEDIVKQVLAGGDLEKLALSDKEFVLAHGTTDQADQVFTTVKGKTVQIPGALVIESSPTVLKVAVSDDAIQSKTADFTFNLAAPEPAPTAPVAKRAYEKKMADMAAATAVGQTVTLQGTYDSYTSKPIMIIMNDGSVILKKAAPVAKPTPARRPH